MRKVGYSGNYYQTTVIKTKKVGLKMPRGWR